MSRIDHLSELLARVRYPGHWFAVEVMGDGHYLQIQYNERDVVTGERAEQHGRKWYLSPHATDSEVLQTALKAALTSAEHRVREHMLVDGVRTFGPHLDIDKLVDFVKNNEEKERA